MEAKIRINIADVAQDLQKVLFKLLAQLPNCNRQEGRKLSDAFNQISAAQVTLENLLRYSRIKFNRPI